MQFAGTLDVEVQVRILYGPIASWRFGRSLGVDPLAAKQKLCPFSCLYCQYGQTERPVTRRQRMVSVGQLQAELKTVGQVAADCVTFAGLGEPTLALNLSELVAAVRQALALPVLILTGGGLMPRGDVRRDLHAFDGVIVKLDAPDEPLFRRINRPGSGFPYALAAIVSAVRQFRRTYVGRLVLQMMFVQANKNAAPQMADLARSLNPDEVQLNTPLQPGLGEPVSASEMQWIARAFADLPVHSVYDDTGTARVSPRFL
jgi:wyosine [tRNA(Phe)-imidazoG37] synthetase (radical SAM superfamily)